MKKASLLIIILILTLPLLFSCGGAGEDTTAPPEAESTAPEVPEYTVAVEKETAYTIIRPDQFDERSLQATMSLRRAINEKYSVDIPIKTDWSKENKNNDTVTSGEDVLEILIGDTNRAETRDVAAEYADVKCGYVIKAVNGKIVIWGTDIGSLSSAIEYFTAEMLADGALTVKADYLCVWNLSGEGMPLDLIAKSYSVIIPTGSPDRIKNSADLLATKLFQLGGVRPSVTADQRVEDKSGKEILIGYTDRAESAEVGADLKYMDYAIRITEDKIVLIGGSPLATQNAVSDFIAMLTEGKIASLDAGFEYKKDYHSLFADSLIYRVDEFVPVWASEFTPAAWLTDYEEKLYALTSPTGRMTADAHRGDVQNYPENSLEGILSAIMMGCDVIEIDIRLTKDNVMVLMHDASLKRTTDWNNKKGKNGLPSSDKVEDWTYEQLLELRLLYDGKATDCKIPTMYEAAQLFVGRAQIHFDCKIDTIDKNSDVYLLAEETGSKECFFYYYGISTMQTWLSKNPDDAEFKAFVAKVRGYLAKSGHELRKRNYDLIAQYGDHAEGWHKQYADGRKMVFTNKIYDFCRYISANEGPITIN